MLSDKFVVVFKNYGKKGMIVLFDFEVCFGEIVGLVGLLGLGCIEIVEVIFGIKFVDSGMVLIKGKL